MEGWRILGIVVPLLLIVWVSRRLWRKPGSSGAKRPRARFGSVCPGAAGAFYEMLNEDRRRAIEIVVEQRAERRDPEDADGNLPDLDRPKGG